MQLRPVPASLDFRSLEETVRARWERHDIFARSVQERTGDPELVFYEGPPTANGRPGLHHLWARAYKDLFCRYWTMRGHRVPRRGGWDTHGLPVEVEVERRLGFTGKREIEAFGVEAFVEECRSSVLTYVEEWERLTARLGYWADTEHAYWTMDPSYVQSVWWHLRQLFDKGLLFEDVKVLPYCPRCGTALSSHELGQPEVYRDVEDPSAYVRLPLAGGGPPGAEALVVWTTTPWTLVSNSGVAVNPELAYVVCDGLVVAAQRVDAVLGERASERASDPFPGSALVGARYRRPFELVEVPAGSDGWRVVPASFVDASEGSGLVHLAPAFGADDWLVGRAHGLPTLNPVGPDGRFTAAAGWLEGIAVKEADEQLLAHLDAEGLLVRAEAYLHAYPHCWRCRTALLYWGKPSWYVATSRYKGELLAANAGVRWRPEHVRDGRFGEWLANNVDWALSRDRYWGTPLPIWRCPSGHVRCVASLAELSELAGRDVTGLDPHRPYIDTVTFRCPECAGDARRVEAVIDVWFDSGSMPAAQWGYPLVAGSERRFAYPAAFVCEAVDQTRGWFYSLLAVNQLVHGSAPYDTVLCLGHIVDAEGRKMSKSLGNVLDPWAVLDTRGADPVRWWMFHHGSPWTSTRTSLAAIDASTSEVLVTLWHTWSFMGTYGALNGFDPQDAAVPRPEQRSVLDRWARSRVAGTVEAVTSALGDYQPLAGAVAIGDLVEDLSNWYVRRSRRRFWRTDPTADPADALAAQATLHEALVTVALLLAPFCPFLAEEMWGQLTDAPEDASVHLARWPEPEAGARDVGLEDAMALARRLSSLGRAARSQAGVKVRQPLRRALVVLPPDAPGLLAELVAEELNVDEVTEASELGEVLDFELVPNFRLLGPRLGARAQEVRQALAGTVAPAAAPGAQRGSAPGAALRSRARAAEALERGEPVTVELPSGPVQLAPEELEVRIRGREGFSVSREGTEAVALDLDLDDELRHRGLLRDVLRQLQELRRSSGLQVSDRVRIWLEGLGDLEADAAEIGREALAPEVRFGTGAGPGATLDLDGRLARAWVERVP